MEDYYDLKYGELKIGDWILIDYRKYYTKSFIDKYLTF